MINRGLVTSIIIFGYIIKEEKRYWVMSNGAGKTGFFSTVDFQNYLLAEG